ncbi:MAG: NAD(P)H-dependent flavin oxidoreductase [Velocimicrobium sp.]
MGYKPLKIGNLTATIPIIQGGMGVGISLSSLAGAVAKEGGIGIISAAQIGFLEPDFDQNPLKSNLRAMEKEYKKAREIAPKGIIGFNIMVAMKHYEEYVRCAKRVGADLIISGAGLPTMLPDLVSDRSILIAPIVSTKKSAQVILKYWDRKYKRCPDLVVIEGPKAGGHLGFHREELSKYEEVSYDQEVLNIRGVIREYETKYQIKIPIVLAGGIDSDQEVSHAFCLGMDGVQVASRFVTTRECDASPKYKDAYLKAKKEDIVIVKSPVGMPGRAIRNLFLEKIEANEKEPITLCHQCLRSCNPVEIPYCITDALINAAKGDTDHALLFCGAHAYKQNKMETVKEVIESLMK